MWAKAINANTNYLGAAVTAAGGFVSAYPGNLCLVGDQTGIADEIAVNGGTLAIGTADADCSLADGLPIRVCRGAKLFLPKRNAVANNPLKFDGTCGEYGTVELPVDQLIASVAVRDVFESDAWATLPAGTPVTYLTTMYNTEAWDYIETVIDGKTARGFVPDGVLSITGVDATEMGEGEEDLGDG